MGLLFGKFLCAIAGTAFFLMSDAVPTHLRTANPLEGHVPMTEESVTAKPKIVWTTTEKTRHETGGSEGCFGISTGSGGADLFALSPNVVAITFSEYGCKGQPTVAVCGTGVANRLQQATMRVNDVVGEEDVEFDAPVSVGAQPSMSCPTGSQMPVQTTRYDSPGRAFRGTALQRPDLRTVGCAAETASVQYSAERATRVSDPARFALEEYSTFMSLRMPEPAVAKSVFLARVDSLGTIPAVQTGCIPAATPATQTAAAVACPETPPAPMASPTAPAVMATPIISAPAQTLVLECPVETANRTAGFPASVTSPATYTGPALLPGPVIVSVPSPAMRPAPTAARLPVMATPAPVVYVIDD